MTYSLKVKQGRAVHELNEVHLIQEASVSRLPSLSVQKLKAARILSSSSNMYGQYMNLIGIALITPLGRAIGINMKTAGCFRSSPQAL
jgi:hypothetical protein